MLRRRIPIRYCKLKYPTGEEVKVKFKVIVWVTIGKYSLDFPMLVADINDDCLLGADFLRITNLGKVFESALGISKQVPLCNFVCSRIENCEDKIPDILKELFKENAKNLDSSQKRIFADFLSEFQDIFSENIVAGNCEMVEHEINLSDVHPIKQAPRRIPISMRKEVNKIIEEMRSQRVIEESQSPWVSPAVLVKKKDGTIRFCVDYRKLNTVTIKDSYPLPRIDDILDQLSGNSWFSTLDLKSGYWQIKIAQKDKAKTAFSVGNGLWQFNVMPFGLCNAPATFERLMEQVLQKLLSKICLVYLDDVIIFSQSFDGMIENLREVFLRLRSANLKLNPKKCVLFGRDVKYLGHVVSEKGITTDPEKINAVRNWPVPQNKKQIRSFLGFCSYYRKFIKGFSSIAKPLYNLTKNASRFEWTTQCQETFNSLKQVLTSSSVLSFPKENGMFILDTDASNLGIGAVLSQEQNGIEKVIAYYSRTLNNSEKNYCVTRKELLAVIDSIKSFHHYLYGRGFVVRTDHISLKWLMSFKNLEGQLARWLERLQQYDFEIIYRKGQSHKNADGLSRRPCLEINCKYCSKIELKDLIEKESKIARITLTINQINSEEWRKDQLEDPDVAIFVKGKEEGRRPSWQEIAARDTSAKVYWSYWDALMLKDDILYKKWEAPNLKSCLYQIVVPRKRISSIIKEAHDSPSGGHFGVNKTLAKIRKRFYWATSKSDVEDWCRTCESCIAKKGPSGKGKSPLQIFNVGAPFERVEMDILGPLPQTISGNRYLLVVTDCFTKWVEAIPLKNIRAKKVAEAFVSHVVSRHGVPLELHTDQGKNFESKIFQELTRLLGIRKTRTTALHPQSDGQVERQHQTIINYLAKFISENQKDWERWIPMYLLAYRTSKHETTGVTPSELYFARDLRLPLDLLRGCPPGYENEDSAENYVSKLKKKLKEIHVGVRQRLEIKSSRTKAWYDQKARQIHFEEGQKVWFFNPRREKGKTPKLQNNWQGPYKIIKRLGDVVFCIQKSHRHKRKIVHSDRLAPFLQRREIV